jgi:hypothetical protein
MFISRVTLCLGVAFGLAFAGLRLHAQGVGAGGTFRPALLESFAAAGAGSERDALRGPGAAGSVAVNTWEMSVGGRTALGPATQLRHGLAWARHDLGTAGVTRLPDALQEVTLSLGLQHQVSPTWQVAGFLRPGFYGEGGRFGGRSFNAPALFTALYTTSPELTWILGLRADAASDRPVLPIAGLRWQWAPEWTFNLGFPRAGLAYRPNEKVTYQLGATAVGGGYRVATPWTGVGGGRDAWLEYRDIRMGAGAEWRATPASVLTVELGVVANRRFDYFNRDVKLKGSNPLFFSLGWRGRF